ncbi:glycoside hydrolase family 3 N-terminal domain-containing protein [Nocardioides xinjiangensis]|uniref:glycoside hydrolase family 3 N-terminal domain-containing protein n=1 Tax=Nocardioides xinjiangensis TaxID=2817376 RepID=UPI001B308031|nr:MULTISPECIES: glycoside hydrolase family 3 N-terminal domain-containing protein [unclassified Nocardioides]
MTSAQPPAGAVRAYGRREEPDSAGDPADEVRSLALRVLLPGFEGTTLPADYRELLEQGLGGICYFGSNTADGPAALAALSAAIRAANPVAVIAVDEEGGDVSRLHTREPSPVLGAAALGGAGDLGLTEAVGRWVGHELAAVGVNLDLAPDADVNSDPDNPVIGTRSFGADPEQVAAHAAAWTRGLQSTGVAACAKHFPGHGDTATDSHLALPRIDVDADTLARRELVPFDAVVEAGVAAVMTSHIVVAALDRERPATLSPVVLSMLREVLDFDGVIVSDALDMAGASAELGIAEASVQALAAGCDLLCIGPDKPASLVIEVRDAVVAAVGQGRLGRDRLEDAAARVAAVGVRAPGSTPEPPDAPRQAVAARSALQVDGDLPDLAGASVLSVETVANIAVGDVAWGIAPDHRLDPQALDDGLPDGVPAHAPLVVQVRDAHRRPEVLAFLRSLARSGRPAVVVEWGWPATYDVGLARICTRGSSAPGVAAVVERLREAGWTR